MVVVEEKIGNNKTIKSKMTKLYVPMNICVLKY